jgi:hypothetical protein
MAFRYFLEDFEPRLVVAASASPEERLFPFVGMEFRKLNHRYSSTGCASRAFLIASSATAFTIHVKFSAPTE